MATQAEILEKQTTLEKAKRVLAKTQDGKNAAQAAASIAYQTVLATIDKDWNPRIVTAEKAVDDARKAYEAALEG